MKLQDLGSNLILKDKKLLIELKTPFTAIRQIAEKVTEARAGFEPKKSGQNKRKFQEIYSQNSIVLRGMNKVRTWLWNNLDDFWIPDFKKLLLKKALIE